MKFLTLPVKMPLLPSFLYLFDEAELGHRPTFWIQGPPPRGLSKAHGLYICVYIYRPIHVGMYVTKKMNGILAIDSPFQILTVGFTSNL